MRINRYRPLLALGVIAIIVGLWSVPLPHITIEKDPGRRYTAVQLIAQVLQSDFAWRSTGVLFMSGTAPTIVSGFGTGPSILTQNGTSNFIVMAGTGTSGNSSGIIGLPATANRWNCQVSAPTPGQTTKQSYLTGTTGGATTTNVLVFNYGTGITTTFWNVGDQLIFNCFGS